MRSRFFKKFILPLFVTTFSNNPILGGEFTLLEDKNNNQTSKIKWSKLSSEKKNKFSKTSFSLYRKELNKDSLNTSNNKINPKTEAEILSAEKKKSKLNKKNDFQLNKKIAAETENHSEKKQITYESKKDELEITSDMQSEKNGILYAEGNVLVSFRGKYLKAETLDYNKKTQILKAKGDIKLIIGQQIFLIKQIEYDFANKKGYMLEVNGLVNTNNFIDDIISTFSYSDINKIESLLEVKKQNVLYTPGKVENWIFSTKKIDIDGVIWKSEKAFFTNDLLELKQVKIVINSLEVTTDNEKLKYKSSLNYLILDEKLSIPFWFGKRTLTKSSEGFDSKNSWNVGYENLDKDGFFIGRKLNSKNLSDNFFITLEPQFLIQRAFKGYTKSFVKKGDSITGERIKRETTFSDYFALNTEIKGKVNNWDLQIDKQVNSFDIAKFNDAFRLKSNLSKEIDFLDTKWQSSFYSVYRDRIWNGSLGESEIYTGYGSKLEKQNTWEENGIKKTEVLSFGMAKLKGEALNYRDLTTSLKGNVFYSLDQKFPINIDNPSSQYIDSSFEYIPGPIKKGVSIDTRVALSSSLYESGKHQEYLGLGAGPEIVFGNFKNKFFDYTRVSFFPFYKFKSGDSLFKFDQISDKFTLDITLDQQIYGPLILKSEALFNIDSESSGYGDVINSRISLNWEKRSYDLGVFYQPHNHAGGIAFSLFGFQ